MVQFYKYINIYIKLYVFIDYYDIYNYIIKTNQKYERINIRIGFIGIQQFG